jgi:multidrug efflux pump subunit AcrB
MNIAEYSVKNKVITWLMTIVLVGGGFFAYQDMGKLEDPAFTIKEARVITLYPGATAKEVESEVTFHIEDALQQLEQLDELSMSVNRAGYSEVAIKFKDKYRPADMPNIYDELRRKITDAQSKLPPGAQPSIVVDDFADVFGIFSVLSGDGYTYRELKDNADFLKRQLVLINGVRKVTIEGELKEAVFIEVSRNKLAQFGLSPKYLASVLSEQNVVAPSGAIRIGKDYIRIDPTGTFTSAKQIENILISSEQQKIVRLRDVAEVKRVYEEIPQKLFYHNSKPGIGIGISMQKGVNVIDVGTRIDEKLSELRSQIPLGMTLDSVYDQPKEVDVSVQGFVLSVVQALGIVVIVLLFFMGMRVGLIIGAVLLITVSGTLWIMKMYNLELQRISLGALIIALGMLVDNAIVVAEGMLVRIRSGVNSMVAARESVGQTIWALLGGTVIGILAFSGIGLAQSASGEYTSSLFWVILISLLLSWVTAITITPLLCSMFIKADETLDEQSDPYSGAIFRLYKRFLSFTLRFRFATLLLVVGLFFASLVAFGQLKDSFFPDSNTPLFFVDVWEVEGTDIRHTRDSVLDIERFIKAQPGVVSTTPIIGGGAMRFTLVYAPEPLSSSYGQIIVKTESKEQIALLQENIAQYMDNNFPDLEPKIKNLRLGPGGDSKIELRFSGPDPSTLREISEQAKNILYQDAEAVEIRDNWRQPVKVLKPIFNEEAGIRLGITRSALTEAIQASISGKVVGKFKDENRQLNVYMRSPENEHSDVTNLNELYVFSPVLGRSIPIAQVVNGVNLVWENGIIRNRDRLHTITVSANPSGELASPLFNRIRASVENMELPEGYSFAWGGEYESSLRAKTSLFSQLPNGFILMVIVSILLFGQLKQPLIIWMVVPLAIIGIAWGLLLTNGSFDFMALLGALSLIGLLIKNAIVLIDEIDNQREAGKETNQAIIDSSISRLRPILMAASTTILGLIPLLSDVFFVNMSITIMAGLGFATLLTLIVVPVLYSLFFTNSKRLEEISE